MLQELGEGPHYLHLLSPWTHSAACRPNYLQRMPCPLLSQNSLAKCMPPAQIRSVLHHIVFITFFRVAIESVLPSTYSIRSLLYSTELYVYTLHIYSFYFVFELLMFYQYSLCDLLVDPDLLIGHPWTRLSF